ncbi:cation diffusion facilitator family transporter [Sphingomonas oryzagri]
MARILLPARSSAIGRADKDEGRRNEAPSARTESPFVVIAALAINILIAISKFVVAAVTGSSAMASEGLHSSVDCLNQLLLLWGAHRAKQPPDDLHPAGYQREIYFWSFVVAIMIFATGSGLSLFEGYSHLVHPALPRDTMAAYIVLAIAFVLEATSWVIAARAFSRTRGTQGWWAAIERSKDPAVFVTLFEDSAALIGILIAAAGLTLARLTGNPRFDAAASIAIGLLLAAVATMLARKSKGLLIGERASAKLIAAIRAELRHHPEIDRIGDILAVHLGPESVFVTADVDFVDRVEVGRVERLLDAVEQALRADWPQISSLYIRPRGDIDETPVG